MSLGNADTSSCMCQHQIYTKYYTWQIQLGYARNWVSFSKPRVKRDLRYAFEILPQHLCEWGGEDFLPPPWWMLTLSWWIGWMVNFRVCDVDVIIIIIIIFGKDVDVFMRGSNFSLLNECWLMMDDEAGDSWWMTILLIWKQNPGQRRPLQIWNLS